MAAASFISTMTGSLDAKARVCIPASFRQILALQMTNGVYLCPSFSDPALEGFGQVLMDKTAERLTALDPFLSSLHDDLASQIVSETALLPIDENGRVRLPDSMIAAAQLKERVLFVGMVQKFQIWDPDVYAPIKAKRLEGARAARLAGGAP
jgi:MraZ protein